MFKVGDKVILKSSEKFLEEENLKGILTVKRVATFLPSGKTFLSFDDLQKGFLQECFNLVSIDGFESQEAKALLSLGYRK